MRTHKHRCGLAVRVAIAACLTLVLLTRTRADEGPAPAPATDGPSLSAALATTRTRGAATVAVFTSADEPASARLWQEFHGSDWVRNQRGLVQAVNVTREAEPDAVRSAGVTRFPTAVVYGRGPGGLTVLAAVADCTGAEDLVRRLNAMDLGLALEPTAALDPAVKPAGHGDEVRPSQQHPTPTPPPSPPSSPVQAQPPQPQPTQPQPQPQPQFQLQAVPQQVNTTAGLIQVPGQSLMIQQAPPQVFLAPQQAPVVYVPQVMTQAPAPTFDLAASPPAQNFFLPAASPAPAPAPVPVQAPAATLAVAAPAPAPAATGVVALASGPPTLAAVTNQTLQLAASNTSTRVRVRGPGLVGSSLARFGERLTRFGRARIETVQETSLEAPLSRSAPGGLTTISTTSAAPVASQPPTLLLQPPPCDKPQCEGPPHHPGCNKPRCEGPPQPPVGDQPPDQGPPQPAYPSPQKPSHKSSLFRN